MGKEKEKRTRWSLVLVRAQQYEVGFINVLIIPVKPIKLSKILWSN